MTPLFGRRCFLTWVKKWVLLTVFLKKTENLWKIVGCFWTWQKGVFWGLFFWGFNVIVVCFCVSAIVPKVLKMLVFPVFAAFSGVASSCLFVFGRFGCFYVSCFWVSFWCWLCFCLFALFCFVVGICCFCFCFFFCVFFFVFFSLSFCFVFFGGFKGQVRWPEGPPHLALKPSLFFGYCFLFVLFCAFFGSFLFLFLFFGGFKGQVRWPKGPPHLALNPPYLFFCFFFLLCLFFLCFFNRKIMFSPPEKAILFVYLCFPLLLFSLCLGLPLFSLSLSLSLSCSCFSCFLPVFHFCFWFLLYLSVLFFVSRCYFVSVFLLVVLLCFESSCLISCCFASCFLLLVGFGFCCFHICCLLILTTYQKTSLKDLEIAKKAKMKNAQKRTFWQEQLAQVCSQIVSFFFFVCVSLNFAFLLKHYKNRGLSPPKREKKHKTKQKS